jgi:hypothetical protein
MQPVKQVEFIFDAQNKPFFEVSAVKNLSYERNYQNRKQARGSSWMLKAPTKLCRPRSFKPALEATIAS